MTTCQYLDIIYNNYINLKENIQMKAAITNKTIADLHDLELQRDYENSELTLRELESKYELSRQTILNRAKQKKWIRKNKITRITNTTISNFVELDNLNNNVDIIDKLSSAEIKSKLSNALQIIEQIQEGQNESIYINRLILKDLKRDLENKVITYDDASKVLQRCGATLDKIASFYKEPAQIQTNIQINQTKTEDKSPVINIIAS